MHKKAHQIPSVAMGRKIYLWQYGDFGMPLLVFPSAAGMAHEWEAHGVIDALAHHIEGGKIKFYCIESNVAEAWTRKENDPAWRIQRHLAYERFVVEELVPFIRLDCRTPNIPIAVTGCSLGAFYAANFALKYPETFRYALCMSGRYDITSFNGLQSIDVYYNNPMAYVGNMNGDHLERVRNHTFLQLVCGRGKWEDGNWQDTEKLGHLLRGKGIPNAADLWGEDVHHEWSWWIKQADHYLGRRFAGAS